MWLLMTAAADFGVCFNMRASAGAPFQPQSASVGFLGAPKFFEQRNGEAVNKVPKVSVAAEPSTCLGTAAARTHAVLSKPQAHARIYAHVHTYTVVTVLIPSPVNFCLGEAHHYTEFPLNLTGISCSQCLPPFFFFPHSPLFSSAIDFAQIKKAEMAECHAYE